MASPMVPVTFLGSSPIYQRGHSLLQPTYQVRDSARKNYVFEVSSRVCNSSGSQGLYKILRSKSHRMVHEHGDSYFMVGLYNEVAASNEFELDRAPPLIKDLIDRLEKEHGMKVYFGRWLTTGKPQTILIDSTTHTLNLPSLKTELLDLLDLATPSGGKAMPDNWSTLKPSNLYIDHAPIGVGSLGRVHRGRYGLCPVAIKVLDLPVTDRDGEVKDKFLADLSQIGDISSLSHGVNPLYGACEKNEKICLVAKLHEASLHSILHGSPEGKLSVDVIVTYMSDVAQTLTALHKRGVAVKTLNPRSCLVDENGRVVLATVGLQDRVDKVYMAITGEKNTNLSACNYRAPETFDDVPVTPAADIWSFGCLLITLYSGVPPFFGLSPLQIVTQLMAKGKTPPIPPMMPDWMRVLCSLCLARDPAQRCTAEQIMSTFAAHATGPSEESLGRERHSNTMKANNERINMAVQFGFQLTWFFETLTQDIRCPKVVAHFHNWDSGLAIPLMRKKALPVATVFTAHFHVLARSMAHGIARGDRKFYKELESESFDPERTARVHSVVHMHGMENSIVRSSHLYTAVSRITGFEGERIHDRVPDMLLPNGLEASRFEALHEFQNLHSTYKEKLHEFIRGHFHGRMDWDLDKTLYFFTTGRYSVNGFDGVDVLIEALNELNDTLKSDPTNDATIVCFILSDAPTRNYNVDALKGQSEMGELRQLCRTINEQLGQRLFEMLARGDLPNRANLLEESERVLLKRRIARSKAGYKDSQPSICTHSIDEEERDAIVSKIEEVGLINKESDRVKVVYHPAELSQFSPLLPLDYDNFVRACHLGVFVPYYQPWGIEPVECTFTGTPSISSNLSGFGTFVEENISDHDDLGLFLVDRRNGRRKDVIAQIVKTMHQYSKLKRRQRIELRNRCERTSQLLDWRVLGKHYDEAWALAAEVACPESLLKDDDDDDDAIEVIVS